MSQNIEIKAQVNLEFVLGKIRNLKDVSEPQVIFQEDVFFNNDKGRLKLRKFTGGNSELIFYKRANTSGPKTSEYHIYKSQQTTELEKFLTNSFGCRGIVKKKRTLYLYKNTRIHLDEVENLGEFLELEVMVVDGYTSVECNKIANDLINHLEISEEKLIDKAYIDLLEEKNK